MSSPDGLQFSQEDFLARWMPSSTRAGVILNPCVDLAGSLWHTASVGSPSMGPDDSFNSSFVPLLPTADSSCFGVDGFARSPGGERAAPDRPVNNQSSVSRINPDGELDSKSHNQPLMVKLEELRRWQQHMQEQLKAHQLEELLRLQEEHQKLLGMMNQSQDCTEENSREDNQDQSFKTDGHENKDTLTANSEAELTEDDETGNEVVHERPIGSQMKTFEELLEEQLRLEEQKLKSAQQQQSQEGGATVKVPPKRAFLKRGEGLSRFTSNRKALPPRAEARKDPNPQLQTHLSSRSNAEPTAIQRGNTSGVPRLPVQRKTATLNKENQSRSLSLGFRDIVTSKGARMKVLGSHQRQNTDGSEWIQSDPEGKQIRHQPRNNRKVGLSAQVTWNPDQNTQQNPVPKQVGMATQLEKVESDTLREKGSRVVSAEGMKEPGGGGGGGQGAPQDSFESSFQEKLRRWDRDQQLENMELGEFELLEKAAEELSFSSNSSFVMKVLQLDQQKAARSLHQRRLSSTPIKSPPKGVFVSGGSGDTSIAASKSRSMSSEEVLVRDDSLKNKVSVGAEEEEENGSEEEHGISDISSVSGAESEDHEVEVKRLFSSSCFPVRSTPPYDRRSYQDQDGCRDAPSGGTAADDDDDGESDSVFSDADESTVTEDKDGQRDRVVFDDNDTWNDVDYTTVEASDEGGGAAAAGGIPPQQRNLTRKVAISKAPELKEKSTGCSANQEPGPSPPPASQLMTRLFPSLKSQTQNAPLHPAGSAAGPESRRPEVEAGQRVQSTLLRERLVELEIEIQRFKEENAALAKLRQENELKQESLRKDRLEFEQLKADHLAKFEEYKKEENKKLQKERRLFEKHASAVRAMPDKKEREEIQALKQQLSSLQEELRGKESRWAAAQGRMRQQIDTLREENSSLQEEIHVMEKLGLSARKENDKEKRDAPRMLSGLALVTKGVKFASPLDSRGSSSSPPQTGAATGPRRTSRDSSQAAAGLKSSLKKPSRPGSSSSASSSSSLPDKKTEEKSTPPSKRRDQTQNQETPERCSLETDSLLKEPESSGTGASESALEVITHPDGKIEKVLASGDRLISFPNGTRKEVSADGQTVKVSFFNGDTKQITADQRVIYYYAEAQTTHITYPDATEVLHFPNNQTERLFPDGRKEITFPDQTVKNLYPNGKEESVLTDGTIIQVNPDGTKEIHFNTGQKEVHTADYKRREYPDGTCKTVYADGRQETRYPSGRLRIKDKDGNIIVDNQV